MNKSIIEALLSHTDASGVDVAALFECGGGGGLLFETLLVLPEWGERYLLTVEERNWR